MKAVLLFLLRLATGMFLLLSGLLAFSGTQAATFQGLVHGLLLPWEIVGAGAVLAASGLLIVLGVMRLPVYLLTLLLLLAGAVGAGLALETWRDGWLCALVVLPLTAVAWLVATRDDDPLSIDYLIQHNKKRQSRQSHIQSTDRLDFPDDPHDLIELPENTMRTEFATESRVTETQTANEDLTEKAAVDLPAESKNDNPVEEAPQPKRKPNLPAVHSWH